MQRLCLRQKTIARGVLLLRIDPVRVTHYLVPPRLTRHIGVTVIVTTLGAVCAATAACSADHTTADRTPAPETHMQRSTPAVGPALTPTGSATSLPTAIAQPASPTTAPTLLPAENRLSNVRIKRIPPNADMFVQFEITVDYSYSGDHGTTATIVGRPDCDIATFWSHEPISVGEGTARFSLTPRNQPSSGESCGRLLVFFANDALTTFWGETSIDVVTRWGE